MEIVDSDLAHLSEKHRAVIPKALEVWRKLMLDEIKKPDIYEQHFYSFIGEFKGTGLSDHFHRYVQRSVAVDIICVGNVCAVYTLIPHFIFLGYLSLPARSKWRSSRICVNSGIIDVMPKNYIVPLELWKFIQEKANSLPEIKKQISEKQQDKIEQDISKNLQRLSKSKTYHAKLKDDRCYHPYWLNNED